MKLYLFFIFLILTYGCNKPKTVLICGDHVCVNKAEAEQYFEDNLSLEVKVISKKNKNEVNLVELNLKPKVDGGKKVYLVNKKDTQKELKVLSKNEILLKKAQLKKRNIKKKNESKKKLVRINDNNKRNLKKTKKTTYNQKKDIKDICAILEKCSIKEISNYLIKKSKKKKFPDITTRE